MWNWQKFEINGKQTNLPEFNEDVTGLINGYEKACEYINKLLT